jgi:hypothetical protein
MLKKILTTTAAIAVAVVLFLLATLPPKPLVIQPDTLDQDLLRRTVRGAYHVHTTESDGGSDRATVAAAAARAGLRFVIFTDHGDGTRQRPAPEYIHGVLCLDGVEVSTNGGHYVALDMPAPPYPLGGDAAAVVEDVARLGGFGIAAHPHHPRPELGWSDWSAPIDGIEWINLDSEWRDDGPFALARAGFDYLLRPAGAIASLLDRPVATLEQWDALEHTMSVVGLAAADAHGAGRRSDEEYANGPGLGPGYEASFRTVSNSVLLDQPLPGTAAEDARLILAAIRRGSVYSVVDGMATGVLLRRSGPDGAFEVASPLPAGARPARVEHDGRSRLEVLLEEGSAAPAVPWVISNWSGPRRSPAPQPPPDPILAQPLSLASPWRVEKDPDSSGDIAASDEWTTLQYSLAPDRASRFVALAADLSGGQGPIGRLVFDAHASKPMRVSVQLRFADGARWVKSVYLDQEVRQVVIPPAEMTAAIRSGTPIPNPSSASSVLVVMDLVNAKPGDSGSFTIRDLRRSR